MLHPLKRTTRGAMVMVGLAACSLLISGASFAAEQGKVFKDWRVQCETAPGSDTEICHIFQNLTTKEDGKQILNAMIGYLPAKDEAVMILTLPLGIALPPGIQLQIDDGKAARAPIETCTPQGCRVGVPLTKEFITTMKKGNQMKVTFANLQRKGLTVPVSLSGFSAGLKELKK